MSLRVVNLDNLLANPSSTLFRLSSVQHLTCAGENVRKCYRMHLYTLWNNCEKPQTTKWTILQFLCILYHIVIYGLETYTFLVEGNNKIQALEVNWFHLWFGRQGKIRSEMKWIGKNCIQNYVKLRFKRKGRVMKVTPEQKGRTLTYFEEN